MYEMVWFFLNITLGCHQGNNLCERQWYFSQTRQQPLGALIAMGTTSRTLKVTLGSIDAWSGSGTSETQTSQRSVSVTQCKHSMTQMLPGHFMFFSTWNWKKKKKNSYLPPLQFSSGELHSICLESKIEGGEGKVLRLMADTHRAMVTVF